MPKVCPWPFEPVNPEAQPSASTAPASAEPRFKIPARAGMLIGLIGILMAFGHSILAMSGEESLAQVNRELEYPKHKNLMRRSEEHTSELQSHSDLVCRLLLEKKKKND